MADKVTIIGETISTREVAYIIEGVQTSIDNGKSIDSALAEGAVMKIPSDYNNHYGRLF